MLPTAHCSLLGATLEIQLIGDFSEFAMGGSLKYPGMHPGVMTRLANQILVYGELKLHGRSYTSWAFLNSTAPAGATEVVVQGVADWLKDALVVVSPSIRIGDAEEVGWPTVAHLAVPFHAHACSMAVCMRVRVRAARLLSRLACEMVAMHPIPLILPMHARWIPSFPCMRDGSHPSHACEMDPIPPLHARWIPSFPCMRDGSHPSHAMHPIPPIPPPFNPRSTYPAPPRSEG